jgi:UDP-N-acetylglucosamine/UDP-N-acetylgalactosamine diphosphorylase
MFPIGPLSGRSLFSMHFDRIRAVGDRFDFSPHVFVMTSPATDAATRQYFTQHDWMGLGEDRLHLFCQGTMPAVDQSGRVLLDEKDALALSPDGHGGVLAALDRQGNCSGWNSLASISCTISRSIIRWPRSSRRSLLAIICWVDPR